MKYGLIGGRLDYSLSPEIHKLLGSKPYKLKEIRPEDLEEFFEKKNFKGINVTNPYKKAIIPFLDETTPIAKAIGGVNTVVNRNGRLIGDNTDYYGFKAMLDKFKIDIPNEKFLILGNGATSNTCKKVLEDFGGDLKIVSRSGEHSFYDFKYMEDRTVIINALPVGVHPIMINNFKAHTVIDLNYSPFPSEILKEAIESVKKAISGLYMLVAQAFFSSVLFKGENLDEKLIDEIYNSLRHNLLMKKILLINGPNINMIGIREPEIYGNQNYKLLLKFLEKTAKDDELDMEIFQSNHEGEIIDKIQEAYGNFDGIIINAGGYTHTSIAIADSLRAVNIPVVEVHLSDISEREDYRKISYIREIAKATFMGEGFESYRKAIDYFSGKDCK